MNRIHASCASTGHLEMIIGPMYSGKSTALIQTADQYELCGSKVLMVNHDSDTRYGKHGVFTHGLHKKDAIAVPTLMTLVEAFKQEYDAHKVICIDELQFFPDITDFVHMAVQEDKKWVIASCLCGTYYRTPFRAVCDLIPFCDLVRPLQALCMSCKDGTPAPFTAKINKNAPDVGGNGVYKPVCRRCYDAIEQKEKETP